MKPNVVLIVLDTLRADHSDGLDPLEDYGFLKVPNAIAPSPWTLPSHVSMFTGQLPSSHGIHEGAGIDSEKLMGVSRSRLEHSGGSLIDELKGLGYTTYCASANPHISPPFGFRFDHFHEFGVFGEISGGVSEMEDSGVARWRRALSLLRKGEFRYLLGLGAWALNGLDRFVRVEQLEKGSKYIAEYLNKETFAGPFFLFVNMMEPHEPYFWGEDFFRIVGTSVLGRPTGGQRWKGAYPRHVQVAVRRLMDLLPLLMEKDPLIVVTSDHGQLLGEGGRLGHGYNLADEVLRVPLYVRFPSGTRPVKSFGNPFGLTELPALIRSLVNGESYQTRSNFAVSECFGYVNKLAPYMKEEDRDRVASVFQSRAKVFSDKGSVTYNRSSGVVEESSPGLSKSDLDELVRAVPIETVKEPEGASISRPDEAAILRRLRDLGYE